MDSFINMPSCCRYACFVMHCFVISASSSPRCLPDTVSAVLCFLLSLKPVNEICYVYLGAIISSVTFLLVISKGLLFYAISIFMPCLFLLWYILAACCFIALNIATWCYFLQSLNCYNLQSCHVCLSMFYWFLEIAQCSCFVMLYLYIMLMPFVFLLGCCSMLFWCLQDA